jgi:hypothetical protein
MNEEWAVILAVWHAMQMTTLHNPRLATHKKIPFNAKLRSKTFKGIKVLYVKCR